MTYKKVRPSFSVESEDEYDEYDDGPEPVRATPKRVQQQLQEQEQEGGLFSTPARTVTLVASVGLVLALFAMVVWLVTSRGATPQPSAQVVPQSQTVTGATVPSTIVRGPGVEVSLITKANLGGEGEAPQNGSKAPNFEWNDAATGKPMRIANLGKPVLVNFWGTWCPPCKAEMPEMQKLYDKYRGQVEFVGVSMGSRDNAAGVKSFVNQAGYNWQFVQDDDYSVATRYQVQAVPSSFFIGTDGVIRAVHVGLMNGTQIESYLQQVK